MARREGEIEENLREPGELREEDEWVDWTALRTDAGLSRNYSLSVWRVALWSCELPAPSSRSANRENIFLGRENWRRRRWTEKITEFRGISKENLRNSSSSVRSKTSRKSNLFSFMRKQKKKKWDTKAKIILYSHFRLAYYFFLIKIGHVNYQYIRVYFVCWFASNCD